MSYDDEYTEAVQLAARAVWAAEREHSDASGEFRSWDALDSVERESYMRAAGAALTLVWNRGWRRTSQATEFEIDWKEQA